MPSFPSICSAFARKTVRHLRWLSYVTALSCFTSIQPGHANPNPTTCKQLKSLGYLEAQARRLESDPDLQARLVKLVDADIRDKLESQPNLSRCFETTKSSPGSASLSGSPRGSYGPINAGVATSYAFAGIFLVMWGILVTE